MAPILQRFEWVRQVMELFRHNMAPHSSLLDVIHLHRIGISTLFSANKEVGEIKGFGEHGGGPGGKTD